MFGPAGRGCVLYLAFALGGIAMPRAHAAPLPGPRSASTDSIDPAAPLPTAPEHPLTVLPTTGPGPFDVAATGEGMAKPADAGSAPPRSIYDPLPPALWSTLSLLGLLGLLLSMRRLKAYLR